MILLTGLRRTIAATVIAWMAVPADQPPTPTGLEEKVEKRLVQFDIAVEGDRDAILALTAKDITVYAGVHEVQGLIVDPLCGDAARPTPSPTPQDVPAGQSARPRVTFILFFDQPHLTLLGRTRSLETSRELITRLVVNGAQASIVSSGVPDFLEPEATQPAMSPPWPVVL